MSTGSRINGNGQADLDFRTLPAAGQPHTNLAVSMPVKAPSDLPIAPYEFWTASTPKKERFDAWRHSFSCILELSTAEKEPADFHGRQLLWDLGDLAFSRIQTDGLNFSSAARSHGRSLDHWQMTLLLHGNATTVTPTGSFDGRSGIVQIHPLGRPFHGRVSDSEMLVLWIPRDLCRDSARLLDAAEFSTLDTAMGRMFAAFMIGLAHQVTCLREDELPRLLSATREMILACVEPAPERLDEMQGALSAVLLERARQLVQLNLFNPRLGADMLMRELAISRTQLYRLFEPAGGVRRYIQHRRLVDAHSALSDPNEQRRIVVIAEQRGFDGAEFSRAFKREFGYSPSEVRKGERIGSPSRCDGDIAQLPPQDRLGSLLWRLQSGTVG